MIVTSATAPAAGNATASDAAKATLNYDAFLKLMLQQLKSQDPTNPVDQTQSLAQLASFSNVEQGIKINQKLETLIAQSTTGAASALIGRNVQSLTSGVAGVVQSVEATSQGVSLVLVNGQKVDFAGGVRVSAA